MTAGERAHRLGYGGSTLERAPTSLHWLAILVVVAVMAPGAMAQVPPILSNGPASEADMVTTAQPNAVRAGTPTVSDRDRVALQDVGPIDHDWLESSRGYATQLATHWPDAASLIERNVAMLNATIASAPGQSYDALGAVETAVAEGLLARGDGTIHDTLGSPRKLYIEQQAACDVDGDATTDFLAAESPRWNPKLYGSDTGLRMISGDTGEQLWHHDAGQLQSFHDHHPPWTTGFYLAPQRWYTEGPAMAPIPMPTPGPHDTFALTTDATGDGVCDVLVYGFDDLVNHIPREASMVLGITWYRVLGSLRLIDGTDGTEIWSSPLELEVRDVSCAFSLALVCLYTGQTYDMFAATGYPTGFNVLPSHAGALASWKETDLTFTRQGSNTAWTVVEYLQLLDSTNGEPHWTRLLPSATTESHPLSTWITGAAYLDEDDHLDLVLENSDFEVFTVNGDPDGEGATVWGPTTMIAPVLPATGDLIERESPDEHLCWKLAQPVGDITGDGRSDVVAIYVTTTASCWLAFLAPSTAMSTHFQPFDGATGQRLWQHDIRSQGWGFVADLNMDTNLVFKGDLQGWIPADPTPPSASASRPMLARMTIDWGATGIEFPRQVHLAVLDADDGETKWQTRTTLELQGALPRWLALGQSLTALAPGDFNGDAVRDPVSVFNFKPPSNKTQVLLSTSQHHYDLHDASSGDIIERLRFWGPQGRVLDCNERVGSDLSIVAGYGRRTDYFRYDTHASEMRFQQPLIGFRDVPSMLSGISLESLGAHCADTPDNRTMLSFNLGLRSFGRGSEIVPVRGALDGNGSLAWISPSSDNPLPLEPSIRYDVLPPAAASADSRLAFGLTPGIPGFLAGFFATRALRRRRLGGSE